MTNIEQDNRDNNETALLLNENFSNSQYRRNDNNNGFILDFLLKRKYLIYSVLILGIFTTIYSTASFLIADSSTTAVEEDQQAIQLNNLNFINNIKINEASRTHKVDEKEAAKTNKVEEITENNKPTKNYTEAEKKKKIFNDDIFKTYKYFNFYFVDGNKGPITLDLNYDDGTKADLSSRMINNNTDNFVVYDIDEKEFNKLPDKKPSYESLFCEIPQTAAPESIFGYKIECPLYYVLKIEDSFYGLHNQDDNLCSVGRYVGKDKYENKEEMKIKKRETSKEKETKKKKQTKTKTKDKTKDKNIKDNVDTSTNSTSTSTNSTNTTTNNAVLQNMEMLKIPNVWKCDSYPTKILQDKCDEKRICYIKPIRSFFGIPCAKENKYLELRYHCEKREVKQPRIAIVSFASGIKANSIYENAISELYQYAKIHNYDLYIDHNVYDNDREIYYMKTYTVIKYLMKFLEEKTYDWIFWVDSDIVIVNPNIKLESFLPPLDKPELHLIISKDANGLNAGIFFLRVHQWSLSYMMRSGSYTYYHRPSLLFYSDQASMNNVLVESEGRENEHFAIVPQNWFNMYINSSSPGYLLIHFAGIISKDLRASQLRDFIKKTPQYYNKTTEEMRKEVLEFYKSPIDNSLNWS